MISTKLYGFILIALLAASGLALFQVQSKPQTTSQQPYIGISFCGNTTQQAITLIDRVKNYTNLFVVQTGETAHNETLLTEICDYAVDSGLDLIVFFGWLEPTQHWQFPWILDAKEKYGDKFLGIYYYDEPGGIEMDFDWPSYFQAWAARGIRQTQFYHNTTEAIQGFTDESVRNYTDATQRYINFMKGDSNMTRLHQNNIDVFTSDYALYWYDYKMGYNTIFAEFGANQSIAQDIALARGAANIQNKTWGAIITWTYRQAPYLIEAPEMLSQMKKAYAAGAQYIIIFNHPYLDDNPYGVLTEAHLKAIEDFWQFTQNHPDEYNSIKADTAMVMPENYGFGLRNAQDHVWMWGPDEKSATVYNQTQQLLSKFGLRLDIVYDDPDFPLQGNYTRLIWWNQTL